MAAALMIFVLGATRARGARALRATPAGADAPRGGAEARAELVRALEAEIEPERYTTATPGGSARIVALVEALERSGAPPRFPADLGKVDGSWDLCFTTNAISLDQSVLDSLAALPAVARLSSPLVEGSPLRSRRVRQEIDVGNNRVRNCVTITAWPEGAAPPLLPPFFKELLGGLEGSEVELTLDHLATVEAALSAAAAQYMPARLRIELQQVRRVLEPGPAASPGLGAGLLGLVPKESSFDIPWPFSTFSPGRFDTTFVDGSLRVSRGVAPGRELRVFRRSTTPVIVVSEGDYVGGAV